MTMNVFQDEIRQLDAIDRDIVVLNAKKSFLRSKIEGSKGIYQVRPSMKQYKFDLYVATIIHKEGSHVVHWSLMNTFDSKQDAMNCVEHLSEDSNIIDLDNR